MRVLLMLSSLFVLLIAQENSFLSHHDINATQKIYQEKECQTLTNKEQFCLDYSFAFPSDITSSNQTLQTQLEKLTEDSVNENRPKNTKEALAKLLAEDNAEDFYWGTWEDMGSVEIFATTPQTFTLAHNYYSYTGGAHGSNSTRFANYKIGDDTPLKLEDIFIKDYKPQLLQIAEQHYREINNITPTQSLEELGWFENRFVLASEFAITNEGIYWLYGNYEIKAYAYGETTFLLPYDKIKPLIAKDSVIAQLPAH